MDDKKKIDEALQDKVPAEVVVAPTKPSILIKISHDKLEAEIQIQRTSSNTSDPILEDLMAALEEKKIVQGIKHDILKELCSKPVYNRSFIISRGKAALVGKDGSVDYLVKLSRELRPKIGEDGTADFKDLGYIHNVVLDQPLCNINAAQKGADGIDVFGNILDGKLGSDPMDVMGENTYYSKDKKHLLAKVDGHVEVRKRIVSVINVLKIPSNVDNSTGDIIFSGDVIVNGDVVSGFKIQTKGNIVVRGSVEGAILEAHGDISIGESMNGMGRGSLNAGGSIKCKYIQSCLVKAGGDIYADTIMYCTLECAGNVELAGKRGALIGGRSSIAEKLVAKTIGTTTHVATEISMCATGMSENDEVLRLNETVRVSDGEITKLMQILARYEDFAKKKGLTPEQITAVSQVKASYIQHAQNRKDSLARISQIQYEIMEASREKSFVLCNDRVHTGVRMTFGSAVLVVNDSFVHSRVHILNGEVVISTM